MAQTVFWSWQSDRPSRETRGLIRDALVDAIALLTADLKDADRPDDSRLDLDHDTKDLAGSPDITAAILEKIEAASVFVADVTPIAISHPEEGKRAKHVANPNVLIELGYAKKALSLSQIVQVWNTAFTDCTPEDLPFDMRGRRAPISFRLARGAPTHELKSVRSQLAKELKFAINTIINNLPPQAASPMAWRPHRDGDPSVWFDEGAKFVVNEDFHGSGRIWLKEGPTRFVRMLPDKWSRDECKAVHAVILGHTVGISWGQTAGGSLTYCGSVVRPELSEGTQATMWFMDTGEIWAVDRWIVNEWQGRPTIHGDDLVKGWKAYLDAQIGLLTANGGAMPIHVRLGASGLSGSFWPVRNPTFGAPEALQDSFEHSFRIASLNFEDWSGGLINAWAKYREIFSIPPPNADEIRSVLGI